jgi:hypothetical protein
MENETLTLCAYHESGRVVFAYLAEYHCTSLTLSDIDPGKGSSMLNGGNDNPIIEKILRGDQLVSFNNVGEAYKIANRLMVMYCAGSCARAFYENNGTISGDVELDIPGQDGIKIDKLQSFMKGCNPAHSDGYVNTVIAGIFQQLAKKEIWKAVKNLAETAIENYDKPLNRYTIEDTLMGSGFKIKRPTFSSGYDVGLSEAPDEKPTKKQEPQPSIATDIDDESPLDIVLKNYFKKIRTDWSDTEAGVAANQVKSFFAKYGNVS